VLACLRGEPLKRALQQPGFGFASAVGLMAAIVVLLITFGSFGAMGLPTATAIRGTPRDVATVLLTIWATHARVARAWAERGSTRSVTVKGELWRGS